MSMTCADIQDRLPDLAASRVDAETRSALEGHLEGCGDCRAVLDTLRLLVEAAPEVPAGLEAGIRHRLRGRTRGAPSRPGTHRWRAPAWGLAAAAVVALVFGRDLLPSGGNEPAFLALGESDLPVLLDEALVAGAPVLDDLTDEEINLLLAEFEG